MTFNDYLKWLAALGTVWAFITIFGCAIFSAIVAKSKNRSAFAWFLAGLFFNLVALLAIVGMPVANKATE